MARGVARANRNYADRAKPNRRQGHAPARRLEQRRAWKAIGLQSRWLGNDDQDSVDRERDPHAGRRGFWTRRHDHR